MDQVDQGGAGWGREEWWEDGSDVSEAETVEDGGKGQGAELVGSL